MKTTTRSFLSFAHDSLENYYESRYIKDSLSLCFLWKQNATYEGIIIKYIPFL